MMALGVEKVQESGDERILNCSKHGAWGSLTQLNTHVQSNSQNRHFPTEDPSHHVTEPDGRTDRFLRRSLRPEAILIGPRVNLMSVRSKSAGQIFTGNHAARPRGYACERGCNPLMTFPRSAVVWASPVQSTFSAQAKHQAPPSSSRQL
jgi:hypothetical protein